MPEPPSLEYQSPSTADSPARQLACRHATGNGGGFLVLCVGFGVGSVFQTINARLLPTILLTAAIAAWYMLNGILHVIAGIKIIRPNPTWEKALITFSWANCLLILALLTLSIFDLLTNPRDRVSAVLWFLARLLFFAINLIAFGRMAYLTAKVRKEA